LKKVLESEKFKDNSQFISASAGIALCKEALPACMAVCWQPSLLVGKRLVEWPDGAAD